ncbi:Glycoside Hydrolase Family 35 protein [Glomus cerebriforme]|uniref:beta-galactosidase n=1 Tax=Glomus cerebriforme TaxID=658196 RepID=A0A397SPN9_9GLOM|nr:Glycoside Hydrolase Family 35 protein [Glomus cerebriforme]
MITVSIFAGLVAFYVWLLQSRKGTLPITTTDCAYNRNKYGQILNWDKHCLYIRGKPTLIFSGEFHYWRLPDRSRWESILKKYRAGGFNCIRIYFHWGFHSPDKGIYKFDDNRDVDYLLDLCEKLQLYVLAAPGPYICAETQVGGFPLWLAAEKLEIRHIKFTGFKEYDKNFVKYEKEWFEAILPILACHQITEKSDGCVIALQIENELFDKVRKIPFGLHDEMRVLCKMARDCGITVPFFSNDPDESGSFIAKPEDDAKPSTNFFNRRSFGLDLYGFDKYFIFSPPDAPVPFDFNSEQDPRKWKPWDPKDMVNALDHLEKVVRGFGHDAAKSPIFIPELQGGWYSSYKLKHTFDDVYNYYGDRFTRIVYDSILAQGCTMLSIYMVYGGTNWGTIGDIDGTTSYDYSACIRESGYISGRLRNLRLGLFFIRSFSDIFAKTVRVKNPNISASVKDVFNLQRRAVMDSGGQASAVVFTFLRNFTKTGSSQFKLFVNHIGAQGEKETFDMQCYLPYKSSFIALGNYVTSTGLKLIFSSIPIHLRILHPPYENDPGKEIWIVPVNDVGEFAFEGEINVDGNLRSSIRSVGDSIKVVSISGIGYSRIRHAEDSRDLFILALDNDSLGTLHAVFDESHWAQAHNRSLDHLHSPSIVSWGTQNVYFDLKNDIIETEYGEYEKEITILSLRKLSDHTRVEAYPLPFIYKKQLNKFSAVHTTPELFDWNTRITDFSKLEWRPIDLKNGGAAENYYTSGHVIYRAKFPSMKTNKKIQLSINMRHRCTIFVNGKFAGGHMTFNKNLFFPGTKMGPEIFAFLGGNKYDITKFINNEEDNFIIIMVENLGISRQSVVFNDARNARGIISAKISGLSNVQWEICGVDVRRLEIPFITSGIPDEHKRIGWIESSSINKHGVIPDEGVKWWSFKFRHPIDPKYKEMINAPLRLVLYGAFTSYIFLNNTLIGRYYGNGDGPQHDFYLMDGLLKFDDANQITLMVYSWERVFNKDIKVEVRGWEIDDVDKSGNIIRKKDINDKPWIIMREKIQLN